ncbi:YveK family protein [Caldalkalibacillus mannanilyticus]|uniref:YveK family protein n=1 Tax=Caldalkalibacillus mannanilyticus TaxID=1418 RepID=UPI00046AE5E6|nr:Wzz/FepE/Etk N-terminal domain-containing protein [Caldalkalibacillus mannanilyticus]
MGNKDYVEIDLRAIFGIVWKKMWLVLLISVFVTSLSGFYSIYLVEPEYKASAEILVSQTYDSTEEFYYFRGDIYTNIELINTYNVIIKSPRILDKVIEEYNLDLNYAQLNSSVVVNAVKNSQVMSISVYDRDYNNAVFLANAIASTFQKEIKELMKVNNVHIMAEAKEESNPRPVSPQPFFNMLIAFVIGTMLGIGLIFLLEYLDNTIKTEDDLEQLLGLPVLGTIAKIDEKTENKIMKKHNTQLGGEQIEA